MDHLVLCERAAAAPHASARCLQLALSAEERTRLRGRRESVCGVVLLLQLPRGEPLRPGEWLTTADAAGWVEVQAAAEALLEVRAEQPLALLQAAYHLGNRHVALELRASALRLLDDPVLADLLAHRQLQLSRLQAPFQPESGAYGLSHHHGA